SLPRRSETARLLDEETRRALETASRRARLPRPDPVSRERYLFYAACTRASRRLYLVREAVSDEGSPRQASPFWDDVCALFRPDDVRRWTTRRPLSALVWPLEAAPSERERLRAGAALAAHDAEGARALARAYGWERRVDRALTAFARRTRLTHPLVLGDLAGRSTFAVTELEAFTECSSMWLVERLVDPRTIDGEVDARLRGSVAHQTLYRFFSGLPKRLKADTVDPARLDEALAFLHECFQEALEGHVYGRLELTDVERIELEQGLLRDLEQFVQAEAKSELQLVPRRFEVSFGSERSTPELRRGLDLGDFALSGKIDRIDVDPFSARGIVQDYKSGASAHSAQQIESELKLQIPLYMLVLRDLIGVEPLGGLYRALAGERRARGLLRAEAKDDGLPGFAARDYLDDETFWSVVERAREHARAVVGRIRSGEVRLLPQLVRAVAYVPGEAGVTATLVRGPNPEQLAAIEADGLVFVSAGAGTGKTTVLVERFVRALERGVDVGSILVITYTERAAGELRSRIRSRLVEIGRRDAARELDGAWVSTIHGFCLRLLRAHPLAAGLDPRFRVLDDSQARVLQAEAFDEALAAFCREADPERLDLLATYGSKGLRGMLLGVAETLRAAGRPLELVLGDEPDLDRRVEELRRAARSVLAETEGDAALEAHRWQAARALELVEGQP